MKIIAFAYIYQLAKFGDLMSCDSKDILKNVLFYKLILPMTSQIW